LQGVNKGRNGKGSIYIWASGIGGEGKQNLVTIRGKSVIAQIRPDSSF